MASAPPTGPGCCVSGDRLDSYGFLRIPWLSPTALALIAAFSSDSSIQVLMDSYGFPPTLALVAALSGDRLDPYGFLWTETANRLSPGLQTECSTHTHTLFPSACAEMTRARQRTEAGYATVNCAMP